nr:MAG TPA: hypothetical protein [Caudoviricetes sp.]
MTVWRAAITLRPRLLVDVSRFYSTIAYYGADYRLRFPCPHVILGCV